MTLRQQWIQQYIDTHAQPGSVRTYPIGEDMLVVRDREGGSMVLSADGYGNISDAESRQLLALSNAAPGALARPTAWTPVCVVIRDK